MSRAQQFRLPRSNAGVLASPAHLIGQVAARKASTAQQLLFYLLALLIIYSSATVFASAVGPSPISRAYKFVMLAFFAAFIAKIVREGVSAGKAALLVSGSFLFFAFNFFRYSDSAYLLALHVATFLFMVGFWSFCHRSHVDFEHYLYLIIVAISSLSLVFFVVVNCGLYSASVPIVADNYREYSLFYYENPSMYTVEVVGFRFVRLSGIFWEPGVYQIILNYALYRYLFYEKKWFWVPVILGISLVLTLSTTGYIVAVLICGAFVLSKIENGSLRFLTMEILGLIVVVVSFVLLEDKAQNSVGSYNLRTNDLQIGMRLFLENVIFGTGYGNTVPFEMLQGFERGNSNGAITWAFTTGLVGIAVVVVPFIGNILRQQDVAEKWRMVVFLAFFLISNATEPLIGAPIMVFFLAREYSAFVFGGFSEEPKPQKAPSRLSLIR